MCLALSTALFSCHVTFTRDSALMHSVVSQQQGGMTGRGNPGATVSLEPGHSNHVEARGSISHAESVFRFETLFIVDLRP